METRNGKKATTDLLFENTVCREERNIRTQQLDCAVSAWPEVEDCLWDMFEDDNEFVTLTIARIRHNIRYVQARRQDGGIIVQLGVEEGSHTRLVEKLCTQDECLSIFQEFYSSTSVRNVEQYKPVEFFV